MSEREYTLTEKICLYLIYGGIGLSLLTPLFVSSSFFYPFISTKVYIFRFAVSIMLLAYGYLAWKREELRPRFSVLSFILLFFFVIALGSSLAGANPYFSFWSSLERGEGLLIWLYIVVFFTITSSVVRKKSDWVRLFNISIGTAWLVALFGLGQFLGLESLLNTAGDRVASTLGNPSFLATYLFFQIAFALYLLVSTKKIWGYIIYGFSVILFSFILLATQTRGAFIGLAVGTLFALILVIAHQKNKKIKYGSLGLIVVVIFFGVFIFANRNASWVQDNRILHRIASISLQERTAVTRLATWQAAWHGWSESPQSLLFGYGLENFHIIFDKYFPPIIYEDAGSVVWFDRAHNVIFDRGVTTGLIGLVSFLGLLLYPVIYLFRRYREEDFAIVVVFGGLMVAYFFQNLFVFETITGYIMLAFVWSFFSQLMPQKQVPMSSRPAWLVFCILCMSVSIVSLYRPVFQASSVNADTQVYNRLSLKDPDADYFAIVNGFRVGIDKATYEQQEFRLQLIEYATGKLAGVGQVVPSVIPTLEYLDQQVAEQIAGRPMEAKNYLLAMRYYNFTADSLPDEKLERLNQSLSYMSKLEELTPTRPHIYQEAGLVYSRKYDYYVDNEQGDSDEAVSSLATAEQYFQKAIDLQPNVVESYLNLFNFYLQTKQSEKIIPLVDALKSTSDKYNDINQIDRFATLAINNYQYDLAAIFFADMVAIEPDNQSAWQQLALSYAYIDDKESARETAEEIVQRFPQTESIVQSFLEELEAGVYFEQAQKEAAAQ